MLGYLLGKGVTVAVRHYCGECGHELKPEDRFCSNCGSPIYQPARVSTPEADVPVPPPPEHMVEGGQEQRSPGLGYSAELTIALVVGVVSAAICLSAGLGGTTSLVVFLAAVAFIRYGQKKARRQRLVVGSSPVPTRHIPQWVKVQVAARDGARCVRCGSTENIQFDHLIPFSRGGSSTDPNNIQLLCGRCNRLKSNRYIG